MAPDMGNVDRFAALTDKQRDVLDLLIQHKTSKEISRILGISPHTVDQRILLARAKLDVVTRSDVARAYRDWVETRMDDGMSKKDISSSTLDIYDKSVYHPHVLAKGREAVQAMVRDAETAIESPVKSPIMFQEQNDFPNDCEAMVRKIMEPVSVENATDHNPILDMFFGKFGKWFEMTGIVLIVLLFVLAVVGGVLVIA